MENKTNNTLIKKWSEFVSDLLESRTYTHELSKSTAILIKWLIAYQMKYKIEQNFDTLDFQLYLYNDNFDKEKFNIIINMSQTLGYFPAVIKIDDRDLLDEYKEYVHFKHRIKNDKKEIDYIDFLNSLEITYDFKKIYIQFERYKDIDVKIKDIPDVLYHVCKVSDVEDIKKHGLFVRNNNKISYHPERIYLTDGDIDSLIRQFNKKYKDDYTILEIRMDDEFKKHIQLKNDPNFPNGYYTLTNIPPSRIY